MKKYIIVFAALLLSACESAPPSTVAPDLSLENVPQISLNVARIEVQDNYNAPMTAPHVDHFFRQPPEKIVKDMVARQFVANGSTGTLRVIIEDASVVKRDLPVTQGFMGTFQNEESEEYKAHVSVRFELIPDAVSGMVQGNAVVTSDRMRTLLEDASPADRDMAFFKLSEQIRDDLQAGFSTTVKRTFGWR